jgi:plasmid maintenance system antidote protein VapI
MLGIARQTLSSLVNEKVSVSIEMAYRLSKAFGSTPRTWLGMQLAFDLAQSQDLEQKIKVKRITAGRKQRGRTVPRSR